jgi:hypothetical protein
MARLLWLAVNLVCHAAAFTLLWKFLGVPGNAVGVLGWLSVFGFCSVVIFLFVTSFTYRSNGTSGGIGAMLLLLAAIGGIIVLSSLAAALFGVGIGFGATLIAFATAAAAATLSD